MKIDKCSDEKLIKLSAQYFEARKELNEIFVSPDAHFFYSVQASVYHCSNNGTNVTRITRDMLKADKPRAKTSKTKENGKDNV